MTESAPPEDRVMGGRETSYTVFLMARRKGPACRTAIECDDRSRDVLAVDDGTVDITAGFVALRPRRKVRWRESAARFGEY